mmetsp:Transcript_16928/g.18838  ORF Transcript_16928/g.18838 Transcript_16928/m.18838 type:complete len:82 (+) Transcript_16928:972-1217(+)
MRKWPSRNVSGGLRSSLITWKALCPIRCVESLSRVSIQVWTLDAPISWDESILVKKNKLVAALLKLVCKLTGILLLTVTVP